MCVCRERERDVRIEKQREILSVFMGANVYVSVCVCVCVRDSVCAIPQSISQCFQLHGLPPLAELHVMARGD